MLLYRAFHAQRSYLRPCLGEIGLVVGQPKLITYLACHGPCGQRELAEYFSGERRAFDLPLSLEGTAFQRADWAALCEIPYGETRSYGQIAARLGNPKACRAVGMANHRNPVAVLVPCHRVVGKNGSLTGYAGGLDVKEGLLALEKRCGG